VLMGMPKLGKFVFSFTGTKPFSRFSAGKRMIDEVCGVSDWRLHDLRRTCVSGMARLGVAPHVADKICGSRHPLPFRIEIRCLTELQETHSRL